MITNSFDLNEEQFYKLPLNERKLHLLSKIVAEGGLDVTVTVSYKPQVVMKAKSECQKFDKISDYFNGYHYENTATINTIFCG